MTQTGLRRGWRVVTASSRPENGPNCSFCSQSTHWTGLGKRHLRGFRGLVRKRTRAHRRTRRSRCAFACAGDRGLGARADRGRYRGRLDQYRRPRRACRRRSGPNRATTGRCGRPLRAQRPRRICIRLHLPRRHALRSQAGGRRRPRSSARPALCWRHRHQRQAADPAGRRDHHERWRTAKPG
jgi:hypothetical protein